MSLPWPDLTTEEWVEGLAQVPKRRDLGGPNSGRYPKGSGKKNEPKAGHNIGSVDTYQVNDDTVETVFGSSVNLENIANEMMKYSEENYTVRMRTVGDQTETDSYDHEDEYERYRSRAIDEHRDEYIEQVVNRYDEIEEIWQEMQADIEPAEASPYGDVSNYPTLPGLELGGRPYPPDTRVDFEELTKGTDISSSFSENEREMIRELLTGTGGPMPLRRNQASDMYDDNDESENAEYDSLESWVRDNYPSSNG